MPVFIILFFIIYIIITGILNYYHYYILLESLPPVEIICEVNRSDRW